MMDRRTEIPISSNSQRWPFLKKLGLFLAFEGNNHVGGGKTFDRTATRINLVLELPREIVLKSACEGALRYQRIC